MELLKLLRKVELTFFSQMDLLSTLTRIYCVGFVSSMGIRFEIEFVLTTRLCFIVSKYIVLVSPPVLSRCQSLVSGMSLISEKQTTTSLRCTSRQMCKTTTFSTQI